jgi:hypothetical protein
MIRMEAFFKHWSYYFGVSNLTKLKLTYLFIEMEEDYQEDFEQVEEEIE